MKNLATGYQEARKLTQCELAKFMGLICREIVILEKGQGESRLSNAVKIDRTRSIYLSSVFCIGDYSGILWKLSNTSSAKGGQAYRAWARNSFSGELNFGIDPINLTIQSFSKSGTVYCNAHGSTSSEWN